MSSFERMVIGEAAPNAGMIISRGITQAMSFREHPAAYKIPGGVGMLTPYKSDSGIGVYKDGLIAAVITESNEVVTEHHASVGMGPDDLDENECWGYRLTGDGGLAILDGFSSRATEYSNAYQFWRNIMHVSGEHYVDGVAVLSSEGREIALRLNLELGHTFVDPMINRLAVVALGEL